MYATNKEKIIFEEIISYFSKLRRAKNLSEKNYYLFDLSLSGMIKTNNIDKIKNELDESLNNDFDEINEGNNEISLNENLSEFSEIKEQKFDVSPKKINFDLYGNNNIS